MLTSDALNVYRAMLTAPNRGVDDLARVLDLSEERVRSALDALADEALIDAVHQKSPSHPLLVLSDAIAREEAELEQRRHQVRSMRGLLTEIQVDYTTQLKTEHLVIHEDGAAVQARLERLALDSHSECISFNPGKAHKPTDMEASKPLNQLALERGVRVRTLYQDAFRNDPGTLAYARWLTDLGGEVRSLPMVPLNLIIVDRRVALAPRTPDKPTDGAVEVTSPGLVQALVGYFEAEWRSAVPFGTATQRDDEDVPALTRQLLLLLAQGATDEAAAHRLGLSSRTVRRLMAKAMDSLGADSRFQAGVEAAKRGWLGPS